MRLLKRRILITSIIIGFFTRRLPFRTSSELENLSLSPKFKLSDNRSELTCVCICVHVHANMHACV